MKIPVGWLGVGSRRDVPKDACHVGRHESCGREVYVWVCPSSVPAFDEFTILVAHFASLIKEGQVIGFPGVRYTPGAPGSNSGRFP